MSADRAPIEPVDLTGRDDVREALDLLLARVGAVYAIIQRLDEYVGDELIEGAWALAAHVYGTDQRGYLVKSDIDRVDPIEKRELASLLEQLAGTKPEATG